MKPFPKGLGIALVTPFLKNGDIDFPALDALVDHVIDGGVDYLVVLGTTAETPALFPHERDAVLARVKTHNAGRLPVVVGIGGNNTAGVINAIQNCDLEGVSAILSVTPFYNRPSQRGLYEHYKAIAEASPLPVILYNVPSRTSVNMLPETTLRLAREFPNIIAIKEAYGEMAQFEELLAGRPDGFSVISGDDATALPLIERGGDGLISVAGNAFPEYISRMISEGFKGESQKAGLAWENINDLVKCLFEEGNPTGVKAALSIKGKIHNVLRLPLVESSESLYGRIGQLVKKSGADF